MNHSTTARSGVQRPMLLIGLAYAAFISLGLPDGLIGVGWPSIRATFGLPLDALGLFLITGTIGYLSSSFISGWLLDRLGVGLLLTFSCLATAMSLLAYGLAPGWWLFITLNVLSGLGAGAIDAGLNTYAARHFSPRTVNWLHACFGIGSTAGPLIMTSYLAANQSWRYGFLTVAAIQLVLTLCFAATRQLWERDSSQQDEPQLPSASLAATLRLPITWLGMGIFMFYTGIELATGQWMYTLLTESRGIPTVLAGSWISAYWASLTVGRILFGAIANRVRLQRALLLCLFGIALGAGLIWLHLAELLTLVGLMLMGFCMAPIFPSLIATTPSRLPPQHASNAVGMQVSSAALGGAIIPSLIGVLANRLGLETIGPALLAGALVQVVLFLALNRYQASQTPAA